ncbi:hypothetical protein V1669_12380 [Aeromonas enteropelogenes]|uniref:hypothetical protein n=1 Tax=Aeromonas enteropelogenes TaxID=29489 RepID=UPI0031350BF4
MRLLNEGLARQANQEDSCKGHFREGRFKSQALLTESALLACMAYVELNPVRAKLAETPKKSDYTSISQRLGRAQTTELPPLLLSFAQKGEPESLPYTFTDYLVLVDWISRAIRDDKLGHIPEVLSSILQRLQLDGDDWLKKVRLFKRRGIRAVDHGVARELYAHHCG